MAPLRCTAVEDRRGATLSVCLIMCTLPEAQQTPPAHRTGFYDLRNLLNATRTALGGTFMRWAPGPSQGRAWSQRLPRFGSQIQHTACKRTGTHSTSHARATVPTLAAAVLGNSFLLSCHVEAGTARTATLALTPPPVGDRGVTPRRECVKSSVGSACSDSSPSSSPDLGVCVLQEVGRWTISDTASWDCASQRRARLAGVG